jgi:hypothetical protein
MYAGKYSHAMLLGDHDRMDQIHFQAKMAFREAEDADSHPTEFELLADINPRYAAILERWSAVESVWDLTSCRRSEVVGLRGVGPEIMKWCDGLLSKHELAWRPE